MDLGDLSAFMLFCLRWVLERGRDLEGEWREGERGGGVWGVGISPAVVFSWWGVEGGKKGSEGWTV